MSLLIGTIGLTILIAAIIGIVVEVRKGALALGVDASFYEYKKQTDNRLEDLEKELNEVNQSFYEIVDELTDEIADLKRQLSIFDGKGEVEPSLTSTLTRAYLNHEHEEGGHERRNSPKIVVKEKDVLTEIKERIDNGYDINEVARQLDMGVREVNLILSMADKTS